MAIACTGVVRAKPMLCVKSSTHGDNSGVKASNDFGFFSVELGVDMAILLEINFDASYQVNSNPNCRDTALIAAPKVECLARTSPLKSVFRTTRHAEHYPDEYHPTFLPTYSYSYAIACTFTV